MICKTKELEEQAIVIVFVKIYLFLREFFDKTFLKSKITFFTGASFMTKKQNFKNQRLISETRDLEEIEALLEAHVFVFVQIYLFIKEFSGKTF